MNTLLVWLGGTRLSQALRGSLWAYPCVEILHILALALLVGSIAMFDARLLGASGHLPVTRLGRHLRRGAFFGAVLVVPSGALLFMAHPLQLWENPVFRLKLALISAAALNALAFHVGVHRTVPGWDESLGTPLLARCRAAISLALWTATIACGRLLAYT